MQPFILHILLKLRFLITNISLHKFDGTLIALCLFMFHQSQ